MCIKYMMIYHFFYLNNVSMVKDLFTKMKVKVVEGFKPLHLHFKLLGYMALVTSHS
jgi:hypothetical protein